MCGKIRNRLDLLKTQEESTPACSIQGPHEEDLGLPRALRNVLDAVQNQVLQLDVPVPDTPKVVANLCRLVRLSFTSAKTRSTLRITGFACLYERVHDLGDLIGELRPGDGSAGLSPVYCINLQNETFRPHGGLFRRLTGDAHTWRFQALYSGHCWGGERGKGRRNSQQTLRPQATSGRNVGVIYTSILSEIAVQSHPRNIPSSLPTNPSYFSSIAS